MIMNSFLYDNRIRREVSCNIQNHCFAINMMFKEDYFIIFSGFRGCNYENESKFGFYIIVKSRC